MKFIRWFLSLFRTRKPILITGSKIQILETGSFQVTSDAKKKYLEDYAFCIRSRMNDYPSWEDVIHALIEEKSGNEAPLLAVIRKRELIKSKYKKPHHI